MGQALTQGDLSPEVLQRYQRMRRESERNELNRDARWHANLNALLAGITLGVGVRLCGLKAGVINYM